MVSAKSLRTVRYKIDKSEIYLKLSFWSLIAPHILVELMHLQLVCINVQHAKFSTINYLNN